jgi:hypothetical protein
LDNSKNYLWLLLLHQLYLAQKTLVSGFTPNIFDMVIVGDISPEIIMGKIICGERYAMIS